MILKPLRFHGDAQERLRNFPEQARSDAGFELFRVQEGKEPSDWKPMSSIGVGVREIRLRDDTGAYRVIYVVSYADAVHVLHAFQKRSQKTGTRDIEVATMRFRRLRQEQKR